MTRPRLPILGACAAALAITALATCGREPVAPHSRAALAIEPVFPTGLDLQAFGLVIDGVRIIAVNSANDTVFDRLFPFATSQSILSLSIDVPLARSPETFAITIQELAGTTLLFSGTQPVSLTTGTNNTPAQVPVKYAGPGQNVATLTLGPPDSTLTEGSSLQFRVSAKDGAGANVPSFYVSWTTSDAVAVPIDPTGTLRAPLLRRTITVQATTPTAVSATTTLQFVPALASVVFDSGCSQSGLPGAQLALPIVAKVLGSDGLGVPGVAVTFSAPAPASVATPSATTDTGGRARTLVTLPATAGAASFQAVVTGLITAICAQTVAGGAATQLAFKTQPASAVAGGSLGSFQMEERDASGNLVTSATDAITIAIGTNPVGGALTGPKTVSAIGGVATFTGLSIDKAGAGYTLAATASGLTSATSNAFDITAAAIQSLAFSTQPVNMAAGTAIPTVVVTAKDALGNTATSFAGAVSLALGTHPVPATLTGTTSVTAVAGIATFSALGRLPIAGGYTLVASAAGVGSVASNGFTVNPAPPFALAFVAQPTTPLAGAIITPPVVVAVLDSVGNVVTTATNPITMGFALNPGQGPLGGTLARIPASGLATFTDLSIAVPASGYKLGASASGLTTATSAAFDVLFRPPGVVWTNLQGGNWSDPANWSPARVPGPSDTASITLPGVYGVNLDVGAHVAFLAVGDTIGGISMAVPAGRHILIDSSAVILRAGAVVLAGSDTIGGAGNLTVQGILTMDGSAITTAFLSNVGVLQAAGTSSITGSFSNASNALLFVYAGSSGDATLTISSGFLNAGAIALQDADVSPRNVTLSVPSGVLTNLTGGSLQSAAGNGGGRTLAAMLDNQGAVLVSQTLTIDQPSATHGNSGQIVLTGGDLDVVLSGTRPALSNEPGGVIDVGTNKLVITNQSSGSFINQPGGTLSGAGTIDIGTSSFITNGTTTVGASGLGILRFVGDYLSGPDSSQTIFNVVIGGSPNNPGVDYGQFQVTGGAATLQGGQLNLLPTGALAGSYPIITLPVGSAFTGDFLAKHLPGNCTAAPSGNQYVVTCT